MSETVSTTTHPVASADPDLEVGQKVGEYEIQSKLGQGGFGAVFKGVHPLIGKEVAIKVLARKFSSDPEMVERFVAEASAVNKIRNRHIIDIFSFGQLDDGRHYYIMEALEGEALDALIDRGPLGLGAAIPILTALAKALDAAHAKGIAHRDLKAENVFLVKEPDGSLFPKLLDFGIAKLMGSEEALKHKTRTGVPIGTPYYMSPEQCRGRDVDHRTDIYAFGVLCYLMLTGAFPHDGDDYMDILMKQITAEPLRPSSLAELPPGVDDAILWMMAKDPAARPANLMTGVHALDIAAQNAGVTIVGPRSAIWDIASQPSGVRYATPPPAAMQRISSVVGAQVGPIGSATTMPPAAGAAAVAHAGTMPTMDAPAAFADARPPSRSRGPLVAVAAVAAIAIGAVVFLLVRPGGDSAKPDKPLVGNGNVAPAQGSAMLATVAPDAAVAPAILDAEAAAVAPAILDAAAAVAPAPADAAEPASVVDAGAAPKVKPHHPPPHGHPTNPGKDDIEEAFPSK